MNIRVTLLVCVQVLALDLLTPNLHHLLCVLTDQALAIGDTRGFLEMWLERMMRVVKRKTKFRGTMDPEKVAVNEISLGLCLEKLKRNSPVPVMQLSDLLSKSSAQANTIAFPDDLPRGPTGSFLLGSGSVWSERKHGMSVTSLLYKVMTELLATNPDACHGWAEDFLGQPSMLAIFVHDRAMLDDNQILTARLYKHERSRDSSHISTSYIGEDGRTRQHVAIIRSFVRISSTQHPNLIPLRFALVDFYSYKEPIQDPDLGVVHKVDVRHMDPVEHNFPVLFASINHKLVYCTSGTTRYLVGYNISSGLY